MQQAEDRDGSNSEHDSQDQGVDEDENEDADEDEDADEELSEQDATIFVCDCLSIIVLRIAQEYSSRDPSWKRRSLLASCGVFQALANSMQSDSTELRHRAVLALQQVLGVFYKESYERRMKFMEISEKGIPILQRMLNSDEDSDIAIQAARHILGRLIAP